MISMAEDIIYCARTGRRIVDDNVVSLSRFSDKPVLVPAYVEPTELAPVKARRVPENDDI